MLKPVLAMDDLKNLGHRILALEDDRVYPRPITLIAYPENRGSLLYEGKLYDWYGREVALDPKITHIVRPFGYSGGSSHDIASHQDNFIVELDNGKLAIAELNYHQPEAYSPNYAGSKFMVTGRTLEASPYLRLENEHYVFNAINDYFIKNTCLRKLQENTAYPLSAIGYMTDNRCVFLSNHSKITGNQFFHHIIPSKPALIDFFTGPDQKSKKSKHPPAIHATNFILSGFVITKNGDKITAMFSYPHGIPHLVASIDLDCLAFCHDSDLYWYEDRT